MNSMRLTGWWTGLLAVFVAAGAVSCSKAEPEPEAGAATVNAPASPAGMNVDLQAMRDYELSMDDVTRWAVANQTMARLSKEHPEWEASMRSDSDDATINDMAARLEQVPEIRKALQDAGMNSRKYALVTYVLMQSAFAQIALQQGVSADSVAQKAGINPANLKFYDQHKAELDRIFAETGAQETR